MKKLLLGLLLGCGLTPALWSQGKTFNFGKIDKADLEMEVYPLDSGAEAVYLVNTADVVFSENDGNMYITRHVRLKILKEDGFDRADISLTYVKGDNIQKLKSATYNLENGKIVTTNISKKDWVNEKYRDQLMKKKMSFPDVKVGSIIEYSYEQNMGSFVNLPGWSFQLSIPVRYSEYRVDIPQYASYQPGFKGYIKPTHYRPSQSEYHIIMEDVPALEREPYVATMENFRSEIDFEIKALNLPGRPQEIFMEDWAAIAGTLAADEDYGERLAKLNSLKKIYPADKGWGNDEESLKAIYNYVRDHFEWNEYIGIYLTEPVKTVWEEGKANSAEINHTLTMFLRNAGIEANPVVLSTRRNGYLNKLLPLVSQFNYVITCAKIGDKEYLLDASDKFRPYNVLPERAINGEGLLVSESKYKWVDLTMNKEIEARVITGNFGVNDEDMLAGDVSIVARGMAAANLRESIIEEQESATEESDDDDDEADDAESLDDYKVGEINNVQVMNLDDPEKSVETTYEFTSENNVDFIGNKIFMNPVLIKFVEENPFKLEERLYPVELPSPLSNTYIFNIDIPEGYEVEQLPARQNLALPEKGGRYMYVSGVQGNQVQVMIRLNLMKTVYLPEEYPALKELFNMIVAKQQEQIVFKPKAE